MMRSLAFLLLTSVAMPALASPATAPAPPVARQRLLDEDARLEKRVTLRHPRGPLSAVLAELSRQCGVSMRAVSEVADEPAILSVTDQKVGDVMHQVSTLFDYRWSRRGSPESGRYELYQDLRARQAEEALRGQRHARALAALRDSIQEQTRLARRPVEQLLGEAARLERQADQTADGMGADAGRALRLRELADPCRRALLQIALQLTPAQWGSLVSGESVHLSTLREPGAAPLPAPLAQALRDSSPSTLPPGARAGFVDGEDEAAFRAEEAKNADAWRRARGFCVSARLELTAGAPGSEAILFVTLSAVMPPEEEEPALLPSLVVVGHGPMTPDAREPSETAGKADPFYGRTARFQTAPARMAEGETNGSVEQLVAALSQSYAVNVIADGYWSEPSDLGLLPLGETLSLGEALERYLAPQSGWRREGEFLRLRRHGWYHRRPREVPERVLQPWIATLRRSGGFTLEETAALVASLRDEQLAPFAARLRALGFPIELRFDGADAVARRQRAALRAYASVSTVQRQRLATGRALAFAELPPAALRWLQAALTAGGHATPTGAGHAAPSPGDLTLLLPRDDAENSDEAGLRCRIGEDRVEEFRIVLPRAAGTGPSGPAARKELGPATASE